MKDHLVTFLFLLAAFVLYFFGLALPAALLVLLGMLAEMVFWVRLFRRGRRKTRQ
jgi:Flp pilus assembly protein TadB